MDTKTGVIMEGTQESLKQIEKDLGRELVDINASDVEKLRGLNMDERRGYINKVKSRRRKNKAARASRRKNRK